MFTRRKAPVSAHTHSTQQLKSPRAKFPASSAGAWNISRETQVSAQPPTIFLPADDVYLAITNRKLLSLDYDVVVWWKS